jgi:hypothetical protein
MTERPILFSSSMVRALLAGTKMQTRRIVKPAPSAETNLIEWNTAESEFVPWRWVIGSPTTGSRTGKPFACPYGAPGDTLWVRESIRWAGTVPPRSYLEEEYDSAVYAADGAPTKLDTWPWKRTVLPSIHCPRGLSRLTLEVTDVRVQRLQDISEEDARAEGVEAFEGMVNDATLCAMAKATGDTATDARPLFACLWDSLNGKRAMWASNPWVWCVSFRRVTP